MGPRAGTDADDQADHHGNPAHDLPEPADAVEIQEQADHGDIAAEFGDGQGVGLVNALPVDIDSLSQVYAAASPMRLEPQQRQADGADGEDAHAHVAQIAAAGDEQGRQADENDDGVITAAPLADAAGAEDRPENRSQREQQQAHHDPADARIVSERLLAAAEFARQCPEHDGGREVVGDLVVVGEERGLGLRPLVDAVCTEQGAQGPARSEGCQQHDGQHQTYVDGEGDGPAPNSPKRPVLLRQRCRAHKLSS